MIENNFIITNTSIEKPDFNKSGLFKNKNNFLFCGRNKITDIGKKVFMKSIFGNLDFFVSKVAFGDGGFNFNPSDNGPVVPPLNWPLIKEKCLGYIYESPAVGVEPLNGNSDDGFYYLVKFRLARADFPAIMFSSQNTQEKLNCFSLLFSGSELSSEPPFDDGDIPFSIITTPNISFRAEDEPINIFWKIGVL